MRRVNQNINIADFYAIFSSVLSLTCSKYFKIVYYYYLLLSVLLLVVLLLLLVVALLLFFVFYFNTLIVRFSR